jgi:transcriptional regulator with XRE-family HTH domain
MRPLLIGERLKSVREFRKLQGIELSAVSGVSFSAISQIETHKRPHPAPDTLQKLAGALDISIDFLLGLEDADIPLDQALARQSLRIFLRQRGVRLSVEDQERMRRISLLRSAPKTAQHWEDLLTNIEHWGLTETQKSRTYR